MRKFLVLLASATLLLVGCAKEKFAEPIDGGLTNVTFTASLDNSVATKAAVDGDGAAASVNRCIMEIYYGGERYTRQYAPVNDQKKAKFTVQVVSNRTYTVAFWADKVDATTEAGLKVDKYYTTNATGGLQAITINGSYLGNDDARDAFFHVGTYKVEQAGFSKDDIKLYRPFAQMNVITTDWDKAASVTGLAPDKVKVTLKNALVAFNAVTGEASGSQTLNYEAAVYTPAAHGAEKTLSMDYLFAPKTDKAFIDIDWKALHGTDANVEHSFAAVPYQRNYRTNIKGALLTTQGQWTVTVEPTWTTPAYDVPYLAASTIEEAQNYIATGGSETSKKVVDLSKATINQGDVNVNDHTIHFKLMNNSPIDLVNFTLPAIPEGIEAQGWTIEHESEYLTQNVGVSAPSGTSVTIDAPRSHVTLNGEVYEQVTATTGDGTLVVPAGVTIDNLIVKKGAVEIHGAVGALEVSPEVYSDGSIAKVVFRACEGLSAAVFEKIYKQGVCNYIDPMYAYKQVDGKYNIYKLPVVAMIGEKEYPSIAAAVAAVPADNTQLVTIKVMSDVVINSSSLSINKNNVVLDGQGHTIAIDETDTSLDQYLVGGANGKYGRFQMIKVSGNDITLKNLILDSKNYRGASLATTNGGKNVSYENIVYKGLGSGHYYGTAGGDGTLKFKNCTFETHGYAIHTAESSTVLEVSDCEIHGWVSYGDKTKSATFTNTNFYSTEDVNNGVIATIRPYCATTITNCTFSKEYLVKYKYDGLTVRKNVVVSLNGCSVEEGELCDIANITCPDDPWIDGGVMAIDATGNATDGFTAGTFVAKQASDINVAGLNEVVPVEGKENVYSIAPKQFAETTVAYCNGVEYETLQAAFDAVPDGVETTVTLVADANTATIGDKNNIGAKTIVLELNEHNITGHMRGVSTLTNSSSLDGATLVNYANLTINGEGTIGDLEGEYHHNALVNISNGTNLTINGGTFVAKSCCVYHYSASSEANTASINVNGGYFKAYENVATNKYVFGIGGQSGQTLTFNYGNAIAEASVEGAKGIYCSLAGTTINVHSGSITANINAIYLNMGQNVTINIDGGKLETLDSEGHANNYKSTGSYAGSSLPIYASAFGSKNIVCNISGGTFVYPYYSWQLGGTIPATWERVINAGAGITSNVANANITASLTGGTYSTNQMLSDITKPQSTASGIVAEGYTCIQNDNGTWTVVAEN